MVQKLSQKSSPAIRKPASVRFQLSAFPLLLALSKILAAPIHKRRTPFSQLDGKLERWQIISVKTTFDIPDDLLRCMKMRAVQEGRKFKDVAVEIFRCGLAQPRPPANATDRRRVKLPLIQCQHPANPDAPLTADQVAQVLLQQEVEWSHEATRR
jgi:hypothetical protein